MFNFGNLFIIFSFGLTSIGLFLDATGDWIISGVFQLYLVALQIVILIIFLLRKIWRRRKVYLILIGFMIFLSCGTFLKHWAFYARFWISKPALDSFAEKVKKASDLQIEKKRVGLFNTDMSAKKNGWIAIVFSKNAALLKNGLLVYARTPHEWEGSSLRPLAGHWYLAVVDDGQLEEILSGTMKF